MDNYGNTGVTKTLGELLIEAGYSPESAKNPKLILDSEEVQNGIKDFISLLDDKRRMAITKITEKKLDNSNARELAYITDIFTKNHQLLTGGDTEKFSVSGVEINVRQ